MAEELGCKPGTVVGHKVRFDNLTDGSTRIFYMTDGMLLREATSDPLLSRYGVVVLDEGEPKRLAVQFISIVFLSLAAPY